MSDALDHYNKIIEQMEEVVPSQMFGKLCGKLDKTPFISFFEEEMVFKLGRENIDPLLEKYKDSKLFDPSKKGRPFKDWIQIPYAYKKDWKKLTYQAKDYIFSR